MPDETQLSRRREAVTVAVPDGSGGRTVVTAYHGMLPEELLLEMMHQSVTLQIHQIEGADKEKVWHGPDEAIQAAVLSGLAAAPVEK